MFKKIALLSGVLVLSGFTVYNVFNNVPKVDAASSCIVTIFGKKYDVSPLQTSHSGGNVFICGTDMTTAYQGMHGTDVSRIAAYLITSPTIAPTTVPTIIPMPSVVPTVTQAPLVSPAPHQDDDENEVEDHEDSHKEEKHESKTRGKSQKHASDQGIASRNEHSSHHDD